MQGENKGVSSTNTDAQLKQNVMRGIKVQTICIKGGKNQELLYLQMGTKAK